MVHFSLLSLLFRRNFRDSKLRHVLWEEQYCKLVEHPWQLGDVNPWEISNCSQLRRSLFGITYTYTNRLIWTEDPSATLGTIRDVCEYC